METDAWAELVEDHWIDNGRYAATARGDPARHKVLDHEVRGQDGNRWDEKVTALSSAVMPCARMNCQDLCKGKLLSC
jgi:hypothetical protein